MPTGPSYSRAQTAMAAIVGQLSGAEAELDRLQREVSGALGALRLKLERARAEYDTWRRAFDAEEKG